MSLISDSSPNKVVSNVENVDPKVPTEAKRDGLINPQNYNFNQFYKENIDALETLRINRSRL